jgi:hypothetical protein
VIAAVAAESAAAMAAWRKSWLLDVCVDSARFLERMAEALTAAAVLHGRHMWHRLCQCQHYRVVRGWDG